MVYGCSRTHFEASGHYREANEQAYSNKHGRTDCGIEISKKEMDDLGLFASILGHIGDGNFHESIMYNSKDPKERAAVEKCVHDMVDRALEMEGTCTGMMRKT
ncbi:hypothetical protein LEMA_P117440.1 [Plenodomus lingam JN3]|uniref:FAD-binding oxidoreductase/transferase type 4 C-terminal domain-containing protein n=1 Tax=Leptosphaeria maculans (strain JN3 / isolate v23.1.3 / race Av1-4-5-6-7-8) TaxID=985895 RepID=E4ZU31_LEPMJ|nr:hypothetical protein LEMA_P117440.1 [Plenodomus lingam JN3]CBX94741.1 hypothetical protein LEMA_P117440.1 [Plenodomus lingam JN3]